MHAWEKTLDFSDHGMAGALSFEKSMKEFFFKVKDCIRGVKFNEPDAFRKFTEVEKDLLKV